MAWNEQVLEVTFASAPCGPTQGQTWPAGPQPCGVREWRKPAFLSTSDPKVSLADAPVCTACVGYRAYLSRIAAHYSACTGTFPQSLPKEYEQDYQPALPAVPASPLAFQRKVETGSCSHSGRSAPLRARKSGTGAPPTRAKITHAA